jgi:DNA-binding GntR family transcriptional regulator
VRPQSLCGALSHCQEVLLPVGMALVLWCSEIDGESGTKVADSLELSDIKPFEQEHSTLRGRSIELLREMILGGKLPPGTRINEAELASVLGISRGPVREAIQRLTAEGLTTISPHRGAFVRRFSADEIVQLFEVRMILESAGARLAALRCSPDAIAELDQWLSETHGLPDNTEEAAAKAAEFHLELLDRVENPQLARSARACYQRIRVARAIYRMPFRLEAAYRAHTAVLSAVKKHDAEASERLMRDHIEDSLGNTLELLRTPTRNRRPTE